jgi:aldehyde dehydrogenase (NAD+)
MQVIDTWNKELIAETVEAQRKFFKSGKTLPVEFRIEQLRKLKTVILTHEGDMIKALRDDLGRSDLEAYMCDVASVVAEINDAIRHVRKWAKPERHFSGIMNFPSTSTMVYKMPYGTTLIISPFNFPFILSLDVLVASIAGGNTAVIKASSKSANCTRVLKEMIGTVYPAEYVTVVDGGHDIADMCLAERFDKVFYTGSPRIGKHVMEAAAKNLTPVALELGGENGNWCVVRKDADIRDAARKIAFFKTLNSGQICININQVAVAEEVADRFIDELKREITRQLGQDPVSNPEYPRLITKDAYDKCAAEAEEYRDRIVHGGSGNAETLKYAPTVIYPVRIDEPIVNHELFNPLLPVVTYRDREIDDLLSTIADREHGLALYIFTKDVSWAKGVMQTQQYGGGCINEVCVQLMVNGVPFGGTGHSGMGAYHGEWGFREFTHPSTVLIGKTRFNLPIREHPYTGKGAYKLKLLKMLTK